MSWMGTPCLGTILPIAKELQMTMPLNTPTSKMMSVKVPKQIDHKRQVTATMMQTVQ